MTGDTRVRLEHLVDVDRLDALVDARLLSRRAHPSEPLVIYDYTARAALTRSWTRETRLCRGLIVDRDQVVVARPFPKFFTADELDADPALGPHPEGPPVEVSEKMDGSLGILYRSSRGPAIATRGAFISGPALWATSHWHQRYGDLQPPEGATWLFEIIYPENRIVVDYDGFAGLVLLAAIDIGTGADLPMPEEWGGPVVRRHPAVGSYDTLRALTRGPSQADNREGLVARFAGPPGQPSVRVKIKFDEYRRVHRMMNTVTPRTIWERLSSGGDLDELTDGVPPAFAGWVRATAEDLRARYRAAEERCRAVVDTLAAGTSDRRAIATYVGRSGADARVVFKMLDGRAYDRLLWQAVRPTAARPFLGERCR